MLSESTKHFSNIFTELLLFSSALQIAFLLHDRFYSMAIHLAITEEVFHTLKTADSVHAGNSTYLHN